MTRWWRLVKDDVGREISLIGKWAVCTRVESGDVQRLSLA
jgi:hypothetical protein